MLIKDLLQELTGVKKFSQTGKFQMMQAFQQSGGEVYTDGNFSVVLAHPKWDHVWKTFVNDEGYMHFISIVKANPDNPHYPKIGKIKKIVPPFRRFAHQPFLWAVKMEKLLPITDRNFRIVKSVLDVYNHWISSEQFREKHPQYEKLYDAVFGVIDNRNGFDLDLEKRNFMQRQNGTIVVADPLWDASPMPKKNKLATVDGGKLPEDLIEDFDEELRSVL